MRTFFVTLLVLLLAAGAGGGGFMIFYCPGNTQYRVKETLGAMGGVCSSYRFVKSGLTTWTSR